MSSPPTSGSDSGPERTIRSDQLVVEIYADRAQLGRAAGLAVARHLREALADRDQIAMVFASAPSQNEFLATLAAETEIDWSRVIAFHLDEYLGLAPDAPQSFGHFLRQRLFDRVKPGAVYYLDGSAPDPLAEARRYADLLTAQPLDIACVGIGENGHLAFNDPAIADFDDPLVVKIVEIDDRSRHQQVHDGTFAQFADVPPLALTVTLPPLVGARRVTAAVPGPTKAQAVYDTVRGPVATSCPASILRRHPNATVFLDRESAALI